MIKIEFLYYNKTKCKRCASTDKSIKLTLGELKKAIKITKSEVILKEKKLPKSKIHLSPTILINGKDIEKILNIKSKLKSNTCLSCCQLIGHTVTCRTFNYKGVKYNFIPRKMIINAIKTTFKT